VAFFDKIKSGLAKTRSAVSQQIKQLFSGGSALDDDFYDELEETLIIADVGIETADKAVSELKKRAKAGGIKTTEEAKALFAEILCELLEAGNAELALGTKPSVVLVVGVNGAGKTTTIGKLAAQLKAGGKSVVLCAADTFRAAAADQLEIWAGRSGSEIVRQHEGSDPAAVVFDACKAALARGRDIIICDTAGRLHNKQHLMNELGKIRRVISRELPDADCETLLVVDATTGQNGLIQAREFNKTTELSGIVLAKLDGTAKGGIVLAITDTLGVPVKYVGVGEQVDDLIPFNPKDFVSALLN